MAVKWLWFSFIVDPFFIVLMGLLGVIVSRKVNGRYKEAYTRFKEYALKAVALTAAVVGITSFPKVFSAGPSGESMVLLAFITIVVGAGIGAWSNFDQKLEDWINKKYNNNKRKRGTNKFLCMIDKLEDEKEDKTKSFGWAAAYATYVSIVGVLSIMGPIHEATDGVLSFIVIKLVLDIVATFVFAACWGPGVIVSAVFVFLWQLACGLLAPYMSGILTPTVIGFADGVGGLIIMAMGLSVAGILKSNDGNAFRTGNLFPAMLLAFIVGYGAVALNFFW